MELSSVSSVCVREREREREREKEREREREKTTTELYTFLQIHKNGKETVYRKTATILNKIMFISEF